VARASEAGPNRHPGRDASAAPGVCLFMGEEYRQGDAICWRNRKWRCEDGNWVKTDTTC
jgi:hypothetical protein